MILDYKYIKKDRKLSVSYVKENGMKAIKEFCDNKGLPYDSIEAEWLSIRHLQND
jgi:predicted DNA binding CopG/RHH family protein